MRSPLSVLTISVLAFACAGSLDPSPPAGAPLDDGGAFGQDFPLADALVVDNDGLSPAATGADDAADESTSTVNDSAQERVVAPYDEAAAPPIAAALDAGVDGSCTEPLGPGNLAIDELMIESVAGAGDYGQWIEVQSALDCAVNVRGLHGECARGAKVATFDITDDLWIPPRGTFVVADSNVPAINHYLPGVVLAWLGHRGDILRKKGSTITLSTRDAVIDTVTYPALALTVGASMAFPSDCDPSSRSDWGRWQLSSASWFPGFSGTPNAPNTDVNCR
ncbi:MAG TPA: hypothetical protein VGY54_00160 [Polyangiaceae bacterium]|nr:hypothetical protein [Polyangiaceae bacterium]